MIAYLVLIKPESSFMCQLKTVQWSFHCYVICTILGHIDFWSFLGEGVAGAWHWLLTPF